MNEINELIGRFCSCTLNAGGNEGFITQGYVTSIENAYDPDSCNITIHLDCATPFVPVRFIEKTEIAPIGLEYNNQATKSVMSCSSLID